MVDFLLGLVVGVSIGALMFVVLIDWSFKLKRLQKDGMLTTKKGTYTFTPKEKTTNE